MKSEQVLQADLFKRQTATFIFQHIIRFQSLIPSINELVTAWQKRRWLLVRSFFVNNSSRPWANLLLTRGPWSR